ncbi:hypothetical protein L1987_00953 [Smallanthus sonchifolius]|uniref:Uncharacterized protein n=1 Tax=Smallanthus sonchifolius TaxID=185202 RepID=A0ACB9K3R0_9ASTR|nr:hypothetical protein L1987_00953 [Smallanthus sonchifolius]
MDILNSNQDKWWWWWWLEGVEEFLVKGVRAIIDWLRVAGGEDDSTTNPIEEGYYTPKSDRRRLSLLPVDFVAFFLCDYKMEDDYMQHEIKSELNPRKDGLYYVVGGEPLRFRTREFCLMIGLRFGKWDEQLSSFTSKFKDRVFGLKRMNIGQLEQLYNEDLTHIQDDDVVHLSLLLPPKNRPVGLKPNALEVDEEWWVSSAEFIDKQQHESLRQSVQGKGIPMSEPHVEKKQTETTEDSGKLDKILHLMQKWFRIKHISGLIVRGSGPMMKKTPTDYGEEGKEYRNDEEGKEYRNENVVCKHL